MGRTALDCFHAVLDAVLTANSYRFLKDFRMKRGY
jgi:hypothetical protein